MCNLNYTHIDRKNPDLLEQINDAPIYKKFATVKAYQLTEGTEIITTIGELEETRNVGHASDWVVTNPGGETYVIPDAKFVQRYESTSILGVYKAKGFCRAVTNPYAVPVSIMASWGEMQYGDAVCLFADVCDSDGNTDGEPYIIERNAFNETYVEKEV